MIGQNDPGIDTERPRLTNPSHHCPQPIDFPDKQIVFPIFQIDREKVSSPGEKIAAVERHYKLQLE
jgi:hypothetical protein